jgi:hypothetical protein
MPSPSTTSKPTARPATARPSTTPAITKAIAAACATGGGEILFPASTFQFGSETCGNFSSYSFSHLTINAAGKAGLGNRSLSAITGLWRIFPPRDSVCTGSESVEVNEITQLMVNARTAVGENTSM